MKQRSSRPGRVGAAEAMGSTVMALVILFLALLNAWIAMVVHIGERSRPARGVLIATALCWLAVLAVRKRRENLEDLTGGDRSDPGTCPPARGLHGQRADEVDPHRRRSATLRGLLLCLAAFAVSVVATAMWAVSDSGFGSGTLETVFGLRWFRAWTQFLGVTAAGVIAYAWNDGLRSTLHRYAYGRSP